MAVRRAALSGPMTSFEWYRDSSHIIYARPADDPLGMVETLAANLDTGEEVILHRGPHTELAVAAGGNAVTFVHAVCQLNQNLFMLPLGPPSSGGGLPRPLGEPRQLTDG